MIPRTRCAVWGICLLLALAGTGCAGSKAPAKSASVQPLDLNAMPQLQGGDPRAWLSPAGNNQDSGFCQARLQLPLSTKPGWSKYYSRAEFSANPPQEIVHFAGQLCVTAYSPQLMVLDASSGRQLDNEVRFAGQPEDGLLMRLFGLTLHPAGLLFARDDFARLYCFEFQDGKLARRWLVDRFVANDDQVCIAQDDRIIFGGQGRIIGGDVADGTQYWSYPVLLPGNGKVATRGGTLIWWSSRGKCGALDISDGTLQWNISLSSRISRIIIDETNACLYLTRENEFIECRELATGQLRWEYRWSWVLPPDDRARLVQRLREEADIPADGIMVRCGQLNCIPQGVALCLNTGDVLALSPQGKLVWHAKTSKPLVAATAFANGLAIVEEYARIGGRQQFGFFLPFMLDPPEWPGYRAASDERKRNGMFSRISVLDLANGHVLDTFEPGLDVTTALVPAYNMVIFGQGSEQDVQCSIQAYPWLEPEGM